MTVPTASDYVSGFLADAVAWHGASKLGPDSARFHALAGFMHNATTAVLFEHLRRADPDTAERLAPWLLDGPGIFSDDRAIELVHKWRGQLAAGEPMHPIGPEDADHA